MKKVLILAAVGEAATGLALLIVPSLVGQLLFGEELTGVAIPVARVTGIALIGSRDRLLAGSAAGRHVDLHAVVALYLADIGIAAGLTGESLWPAVVLHAILTGLFVWASMRDRETKPYGANRRKSAKV